MEKENESKKEKVRFETLGAPDLDDFFASLSPVARTRFLQVVPIPHLIPAPVLRRYLRMLWLWSGFYMSGDLERASRQLRRIRNYEKKLYRDYQPIIDNLSGPTTPANGRS